MNKPEHKKHYYKSGELEYEAYYLNGKRHRIDGPASISYYKSGKLKYEVWYLNGELLSKEEFISSYEHQGYLADLEIDKILESR